MKQPTRLRALLALLDDAAERAEDELQRLSPSLGSALAAVDKVGVRRGIAGVARMLDVTHGAARDLVEALEEEGLVYRVIRERRAANFHSLVPTPTGRRLLQRGFGVDLDSEIVDRALSVLSEEERALFVEMLERVTSED